MKTIILAAGDGSRLGGITKNIPKCLLSFGGKPAILHLLDKLPESDEVCVCVSPDFRGELLRNYLTKVSKQNLRFVVQEKPIGTADAVSICFNYVDDVLISWSDIIPVNPISKPLSSSIFTTEDFLCRYRFDGDRIEAADGNIIGMFFISESDVGVIRDGLKRTNYVDFVDVLQSSGLKFSDVPISCFDFGTEKTLKHTMDTLNTSAYANISIDGDVVSKEYNDLSGDLFYKESTWYRFSPNSVKRFLPNILHISDSDKIIRMSRLDSSDIESDETMKDFLARVVYVLDEYFHSNKYPAHDESLINEYITEPINRCKLVYEVVPKLSNDKLFINGISYVNPVSLLQSRYDDIICRLLPKNFSFIHGDPTLQNIMLKHGEPAFIDPKAKFGNIWLYGDSKYDFAKIYYSVIGNYDNFNCGAYSLSVGDEFNYNIVKSRFVGLDSWLLSHLNNKVGISPVDIRLIHAIIWLRVTGYVLPKSIEQAIVAFLNGAVLLNSIVELL